MKDKRGAFSKAPKPNHQHPCDTCKSGYTVCIKPLAETDEQKRDYNNFCSSPETFTCQRCLERENFRRLAPAVIKG